MKLKKMKKQLLAIEKEAVTRLTFGSALSTSTPNHDERLILQSLAWHTKQAMNNVAKLQAIQEKRT